LACTVGLNRLAILALICLVAPQLAHSQQTQAAAALAPPPISTASAEPASVPDSSPSPATTGATDNETVAAPDTSSLPDAPDAPRASSTPSESDSAEVLNAPEEGESGETKKTRQKKDEQPELAVTGLISYGDHKMFGAALRCNLWVAGVEYDRHIWHYFLKARVDYVVELLPFVLLSEPAVADVWGNPVSPNNKFVHGMGLSPFGFRYMWRSNMKVKPYLIGKAGGVFFPIKVLSPNASYASFAFQGDFGLQIRMTDRVELRVDPLEYFHFSNAFIVKSNPGLDELSAKIGLSYHLGKSSRQ
jgi:hypothetical protein